MIHLAAPHRVPAQAVGRADVRGETHCRQSCCYSRRCIRSGPRRCGSPGQRASGSSSHGRGSTWGQAEESRPTEPGLAHLPPSETLIICSISSPVRPSDGGPERGNYLSEVTQPGRAGQCPGFLSTILPLCPVPRAPAFSLEPWLQLWEGSGGPATWSGWEGGLGL